MLSHAIHKITSRSHTLLHLLFFDFKHVKYLNLAQVLVVKHYGTLNNPMNVVNLEFVGSVENYAFLEHVALSLIHNLMDSINDAMHRDYNRLRFFNVKNCKNFCDHALESHKYCKSIQ